MQDEDFKLSSLHLPDGEAEPYSATVRLLYWQEKIVAHYSQDERLQAVFEYGSGFYERIAAFCFRKPVQALSQDEKQLGSLVARSACSGYGKRFISGSSGISPLQAQELLNQFYKIFNRVRPWLKQGNQDYAFKVISRILYSAIERCQAKLPFKWYYLSELTFIIPYDVYDSQVVKFLKHHFENELEIGGELVKLSVSIEIGEGG